MFRRGFIILVWMCAGALAAMAQVKLPANLKAEVDYMIPFRYAPRNVQDFFLRIEGDTAEVHLPYMGDVYTPNMDRDGLNFTDRMENIRRGQTRKGQAILYFEIQRVNVRYRFRLTASDRRFELRLDPSNAQSCTYEGDWEEEP